MLYNDRPILDLLMSDNVEEITKVLAPRMKKKDGGEKAW